MCLQNTWRRKLLITDVCGYYVKQPSPRARQHLYNDCAHSEYSWISSWAPPTGLIRIFAVRHKDSHGPRASSYTRTMKTLIRLGGCPGWSESSLGAQIILFAWQCSGTFHNLLRFDTEQDSISSETAEHILPNFQSLYMEEFFVSLFLCLSVNKLVESAVGMVHEWSIMLGPALVSSMDSLKLCAG